MGRSIRVKNGHSVCGWGSGNHPSESTDILSRQKTTPVCCSGSRARAVGIGDAVMLGCSVLCAAVQAAEPKVDVSEGFHVIYRRYDTEFDRCVHFQLASTGGIQRVSLQRWYNNCF